MDGIRASLSGIQSGLRRQRVAAVNLSGSMLPERTPLRGEEVSFSEAALELLRASQDVAVNASALRRQDEAQDALLDALD